MRTYSFDPRFLRNLNLSLTCTISKHEEPIPVVHIEPTLRATDVLRGLKKHLPRLKSLTVDVTLNIKCCAAHANPTSDGSFNYEWLNVECESYLLAIYGLQAARAHSIVSCAVCWTRRRSWAKMLTAGSWRGSSTEMKPNMQALGSNLRPTGTHS